MIIWENRNRKHEFMSVDDRYEFISKRISYFEESFCKTINIFLNIIVPVLLYCVFGLNLFMFAVSYIVFDFVLITMEQIWFVSIPYIVSKNMNLTSTEKRLRKLKKLERKFDRKIKAFKQKHCSSFCHSVCSKCSSKKNYEWKKEYYSLLIDCEQNYIETERAKIAKETISKDDKQSKDYEDKREYFLRIKEKLNYYSETSNIKGLVCISQSLDKISDIINKKPIGLELIPASVYIYLDELLNILSKISSFDSEKRISYEDDIFEISNKLSDNINSLVERIDKLETQDVDVSISVLLKELTNLEEKQNV